MTDMHEKTQEWRGYLIAMANRLEAWQGRLASVSLTPKLQKELARDVGALRIVADEMNQCSFKELAGYVKRAEESSRNTLRAVMAGQTIEQQRKGG